MPLRFALSPHPTVPPNHYRLSITILDVYLNCFYQPVEYLGPCLRPAHPPNLCDVLSL